MADSKDYLKQIGKSRDQVKTESDSPILNILKKWSEDSIATMKENTPTASGSLAASIGFKFGNDGGVFTIDFLADDYWDFVNSGVDGFSRSAGAVDNKFGSTYSFKSAYPSQSMVDSLLGNGSKQNWFASKGITTYNYTDKEGKKHSHPLVDEDDYQAAAYMIGIAIKQKGIKPSNFVGSAINEESIKELEDLLIEALLKLL